MGESNRRKKVDPNYGKAWSTPPRAKAKQQASTDAFDDFPMFKQKVAGGRGEVVFYFVGLDPQMEELACSIIGIVKPSVDEPSIRRTSQHRQIYQQVLDVHLSPFFDLQEQPNLFAIAQKCSDIVSLDHCLWGALVTATARLGRQAGRQVGGCIFFEIFKTRLRSSTVWMESTFAKSEVSALAPFISEALSPLIAIQLNELDSPEAQQFVDQELLEKVLKPKEAVAASGSCQG